MTPVPELLLKKRNRDAAWAEKKATAALEARKKSREQRREIFKRAEQYVKEYRQQVCWAAAASDGHSYFLPGDLLGLENGRQYTLRIKVNSL